MRRRLSLLMFLQYAIPGAVVPFFSLRLQELGFSPVEIGWASATQALAALVAPLVAGQVADRWFPAERCLVCCAAVTGVVLWGLAELTTPGAVFLTSLGFWLALGPAITLSTAISFSHLHRPDHEFGPVRVWGTVGWVASGWALGLWFAEPRGLGMLFGAAAKLSDIFRFAGSVAFGLALYALTLPTTPPRRQSRSWLAPLAALHLLRGRAFAVFSLCTFGWCLTMPFVSQTAPLLLRQLGILQAWIGPTMTLSQSMEILSLPFLPFLLLRLGARRTMLLGLTAWLVNLTVLTLGRPLWLVIGLSGLSGLSVCCFLIAGQVFTNSRARGEVRVSAQALLSWVNGLGMLIGNLLAGWVRQLAGGGFAVTFGVAAVLAAGLLSIFFVGFPRQLHSPPEPLPAEEAVA